MADRMSPGRAVFAVVFLLLFVFSHSEELVVGLVKVLGTDPHGGWRIGLIVADVVLLAAVGLLKGSISRTDGDRPRLWGWWGSAVVLLLALDVILYFVSTPVWVDLAASTAYAASMGVLMASSLNADPLTLVSTARRVGLPSDWRRVRAIVPLIVGTWACYLAGAAFVDYFDVGAMRDLAPATATEVQALPLTEQLTVLSELCQSAVNPGFFQLVVEVMPLLLLALGVEFNYFRQTLAEPTQRAVTAATVTVMSAGLVFALSTLPWDSEGCGDILSGWHEYLSFVLAMQGVFTGLATLVWLLIASTPADAIADETLLGR
ncbi:hypothetical protein BH09ACT7_BH09ACT7_22660 [soil metagenome]